MVGEKTSEKAGAAPPAGPPSGVMLPWQGWPDEIACNIACGDLVNNLRQPFVGEGDQVHAATLVGAAGAVAGWAAQQSLRTRPKAQAGTASTKDGRKFLFADDLNAMLYSNDRAQGPHCIGNLIIGGLRARGIAPEDLPDLGAMFQHVSATLGGPDEGMPSTPEPHRPMLRADALLKQALPLVLFVFTREQPHKPGPESRLRPSSWSTVAAWSAAALFDHVANVLPPQIAATIAIESAIYTSKILEPWAVSPQPSS